MMGVLGRRDRYPSGPAHVSVDPILGDPDRATVQAAMRSQDWPAVAATLDRASDFNDLSVFVQSAADVVGSQTWLAEVLRTELDSAQALLVHGARAIHWAWEARGRAMAEHTGPDQSSLFHERLRIAEECLQTVVRREPGNATAWHLLILTARGLQLGPAESRSRFDRANAAQPGHLRAHQQLLQNLCPKWSGSAEQLREFVESATTQAPDGDPLGVLVPQMHFELAFVVKENRRERYLRGREVRQNIQDAANRSISHPRYQPGRDWAQVHNTFALMFMLSENWKSAAEQFQFIGTTVTGFPWTQLGDPAEVFVLMRDRAYRWA